MDNSFLIARDSGRFTWSPGKVNKSWFIKYKLYHIFFWLIYHYFWAVIKVGDPLEVANYIFSSLASVKFVFYVIFQALAVYFNLYFLIPKYLEKSRFLEYMLYLLITILCTATLIVYGYYLSAFFTNSTILEKYGNENFSYFFMTYTLPSTMASMTLAMSIKLTKNWIQAKKRQQLLEKERLETELKFLKSQFNPHFLFNTINSIFVLIHKNPKMASDSLAKFSDLLRYQLYECNEQQIPLERELAYFENFIELEKLRQEHNLELNFQIGQPSVGNLTIAPFILMPFIENAFKHVSQRKEHHNWIRMSLVIDQSQLCLDVSNSVSSGSSAATELIHYGGIGLQNVQRRLNLLYPGQHDLEIKSEEDQFRIILRLALREQIVPQLVPVA